MRLHAVLLAILVLVLAALQACADAATQPSPSASTWSWYTPAVAPAVPTPAAITTSEPNQETLDVRLQGAWSGYRIVIGSEEGTDAVSYGWVDFEVYPSSEADALWYPLAGPSVSEEFAFAVQPDGQILRNGIPWGVLDATALRIIAFEEDAAGARLTVLNRHTYSYDFDRYGCDGTWRMHSIEARSGWSGWKLLSGSIDTSGSFTGTQTDSDGGSSQYQASVDLYYNGEIRISEAVSTWQQYAEMRSGAVVFDRVTGPSETEQSGRFDIGFRTGGHFTQADMRGNWWFCGISTAGDSFHGSLTALADGSYSGQRYDGGSPNMIPISGALALTSDGVITASESGTPLCGEGTLALDRGCFAFTFSEGLSDSMMLAVKLPEENDISADLASLHLDWGNGVVIDDTFDLDTQGTGCDSPAILVDPSYLTTPALPEGSTMTALYHLVAGQTSLVPELDSGYLPLSATLAADVDAEEVNPRLEPVIASTGVEWPSVTGATEFRAVFENIAGDLAAVGNSASSVSIGFDVRENGGPIGNIELQMGFLSAFLPKGIYGIPRGHHSRTPYLRLYVEHEGESFYVMPATGHDPDQPVELKLTITPGGALEAYARFGASEWVHVGSKELHFWPAPTMWPNECQSLSAPSRPFSCDPFVRTKIERIELPEYPQRIQPDDLPEAMEGEPYSQLFTTEGGLPPYSYSIVDGEFPQGITLTADGLLSGVLTEPGEFWFTVRAEDSHSPAAFVDQICRLYVRYVVDIDGAKALPGGSRVMIPEAVVTRKLEDGFYAQSADRSMGIYVGSWDFVAEGWTVRISGTTNDPYEREKEI